MKIGEPLLWLGPYLQSVVTLVPNAKKINLIRVLHHKAKDVQRIDASIIRKRSGYTLNFYGKAKIISKTTPKVKFEYLPYTQIEILVSLAHEIAHIDHWDHTPEHKALECQITLMFMQRLKQEGYVSSEEELANIKKAC